MVGLGNRIDMIKASTYLPPSYLKNRGVCEKPVAETPLLFDDSLLPLTRPPRIDYRDRLKVMIDKSNPFEVFCECNLPWIEKVTFQRRKPVFHIGGGSEDLYNIYSKGLEQFLKTIEQQVNEKKTFLHEQAYHRAIEMKNAEDGKKAIGSTDKLNVNDGSENVFDETGKGKREEEEEKECVEELHCRLSLASNNQRSAVAFTFAPDGFVPNTKGLPQKAVGWLKVRGILAITKGFVKPKKKKKQKELVDEMKKVVKNRGYQDKLKSRMKMLVAEEEEVEAQNQDVPPLPEDIVTVEERTSKLRVGGNVAKEQKELDPLAWEPREKFLKEKRRITIPMTIERFLVYDWCPIDEIMHPEGFERSSEESVLYMTSKEKQVRMPKIDGNTPDALFPHLQTVYYQVLSAKRSEVFNFLKWLHKEYGFAQKAPLVAFLCRNITCPKILDSEDIRVG